MPSLTPQLQSEYQRLFDTSTIKPEKYSEIDASISQILKGRAEYEALSAKLNIPWYFIGILHCMEGSCSFKVHLHNGDPLTARTVNEPKGRPKTGNPPFTWQFSAEDILREKKLHEWTDWSVPGMLYRMELYNGWGYRNKGINTPYLWSYCNHYTKGKYVSDGSYSTTAVSKQCGGAVLLRRMYEKQIIKSNLPSRMEVLQALALDVSYQPGRYVAKAEELQKMLNLSGAYVKVDGKAGRNTSDALYKLINRYLQGDPEHA
jgi:lysozyme family protein